MGLKIKNLIYKIKNEKKSALILVLALALILILFLSEMFENQKTEIYADNAKSISDSYTENLEMKLEEIISSIEGAGKTSVMITLDTGEENVFAKESKSEKEDNSNNVKESDEYEYVIVKSASSKEEGLLIKVAQPNIRGVAVVCEGAENIKVKESIISTVSSVLDIKTNKISISKMKTQ